MSDLPSHTEQPELLAPAGNWECVRAAIANGADAVYFGLPRFNARLRADNFSEAELPEVVAFCHRHGVKAYVAFNTLVFTGELDDAADYLRLLSRGGVDALIVQDVGLVRLAREIVPDLPIHASTQMSITSPEGAEFARDLGVERIVLARELSIREIEKFEPRQMPLEVFVHGALCVAYSGQCLTSESLGQRSANRGECAQACRMPYEMIVDGALRDLGDKRYLLSPQDLAAVNEIPQLVEKGVISFKIEGRLKSPEYVAAVCQVYRKALDAALAQREHSASPEDLYQLEMTFSRGLSTGWMHGVDHQQLVGARFGKKRGPFVGRITSVGRDFVEVESGVPLAPGDGVVFDTGGDTNAEQGGRIYQVKGSRLFFAHGHIDFGKLKPSDRVWKTDDPVLEKRLRQSFSGKLESRKRAPVDLRLQGKVGEALVLTAAAHRESHGAAAASRVEVQVSSSLPLQAARTAPLTTPKLRDHLDRFGESPFALRELHNELEGEVILPIGEINRLRRELVFKLLEACESKRRERADSWREILVAERGASEQPSSNVLAAPETPVLSVLCRTIEQIDAATAAGVKTLYVDLEDIRRYKEVVAHVRQGAPATEILLATPRIQKAGEQGFFKLIENAGPDGVLIRNLGAIDYFAGPEASERSSGRDGRRLRLAGDFSLNVANPITAHHFISKRLEYVTVSYDLNIEQVLALLEAAPANWFELTLHQHMPMFHMEHCAFAAFLSKGSSFLDCGRPCESHRVHLRDRVGMEHPLRADVGCRNTVFNAVAQTGARFFESLSQVGLRRYRVELLEESASEAARVIRSYQALLAGEHEGAELWRTLKAQSQLGVTRGTLAER